MTTMDDARKAREIRDYFDRYGKIHLIVDATRDDVTVPPHLKGDPALCLLLNVRMPQRIDIGKDGVASCLSFSGQPFSCHVPMAAIWAVYQPQGSLEEGLVWPEAIPSEVQQVMQTLIADAEDEDEGRAGAPHAEREDSAVEPSSPAETGPGSGRRKGHLRIV